MALKAAINSWILACAFFLFTKPDGIHIFSRYKKKEKEICLTVYTDWAYYTQTHLSQRPHWFYEKEPFKKLLHTQNSSFFLSAA